MPSSLIDTHCHLDSEGFHQEIDAVIQRALDSGLERMISIGTTLQSSEAAVLLSNRYTCVSAVVGIHPNYTLEAAPSDWEKIEDLALEKPVWIDTGKMLPSKSSENISSGTSNCLDAFTNHLLFIVAKLKKTFWMCY
jgi:Tat protein secretion system quality control protein TatD with DNase activity